MTQGASCILLDEWQCLILLWHVCMLQNICRFHEGRTTGQNYRAELHGCPPFDPVKLELVCIGKQWGMTKPWLLTSLRLWTSAG